jgi:hypothetical protein
LISQVQVAEYVDIALGDGISVKAVCAGKAAE